MQKPYTLGNCHGGHKRRHNKGIRDPFVAQILENGQTIIYADVHSGPCYMPQSQSLDRRCPLEYDYIRVSVAQTSSPQTSLLHRHFYQTKCQFLHVLNVRLLKWRTFKLALLDPLLLLNLRRLFRLQPQHQPYRYPNRLGCYLMRTSDCMCNPPRFPRPDSLETIQLFGGGQSASLPLMHTFFPSSPIPDSV